MNTVQRIAKNTGVLLFSQIAGKILGFFFVMYTARYLGAEGFGILSFALAFAGIFGIFSDLGLAKLTVREVARNRSLADKYLGNISIIKIILGIITFVLVLSTINFLGYPEQTIKVVGFIALSIIFNSFSQNFYAISQAYEKMEYQSIGQILNSGLLLLGTFWGINNGFNVMGFAAIYFLANGVTLGYSFFVYVWKFSIPKIEVDWSFWKSTVKEAWPFGLTGAFVSIYIWIDSVMLSLMKGDSVVGWYSAAYRFVLVLLFIPIAFNSAVFPIMSRAALNSQNSLKSILQKHFKYMLIVGIPIGVGITLLAKKIIILVFGIEFLPSVIALQILGWAGVFIFARTAFERVLEATNQQIIVTKVFGNGALLNIVLNIILIPRYSYIGAAVSTLLTDFIVFITIFVLFLRKGYSIIDERFVKSIGKFIKANVKNIINNSMYQKNKFIPLKTIQKKLIILFTEIEINKKSYIKNI